MEFIIALLVLAIPVTGTWTYIRGRKQRIESIDYKERWLEAVQLLGGEGQLTSEQVLSITSSKPTPVPKNERSENQKLYDEMFSANRKIVQINKAKHGLPPDDDLKDMFSRDQMEVINARAKFAHLQKEPHA